MKSTTLNYGRIAQIFHWLSALLILALIPMGLTMTRMAEGSTQTSLYRAHVGVGLIVLLLTTARIVWRFVEPSPEIPSQITGMRKLAFKGIHILQYIVLVLMLASGVAILLSSGLGLSPANVLPEAISPDLPPVGGHALLSKVFIVLLLAHLGGMIEYQLFHGDVLGRMGLPWFKTKRSA